MKSKLFSALLFISTTHAADNSQFLIPLDKSIESLTGQGISSYNEQLLEDHESQDWNKRIKKSHSFVSNLKDLQDSSLFVQVRRERFISKIEPRIKEILQKLLSGKKYSKEVLLKNVVLGSPLIAGSEKIEKDGILATYNYGLGLDQIKTTKNSEALSQLSLINSIDAEFIEIKILNAWVGSDKKAKNHSSLDSYDNFTKAEELDFLIAYDVRGILDGNKAHASGTMEVRIKNNKAWTSPMISGLGNRSFIYRELKRKSAFKSITSSFAFDKSKTYKRREALRRGGYALAVGDFNNDGISDLYVGNAGKSTLWQGLPNNDFKEVKSIASEATLVKSAAFVDFNNNGYQDLIITRFDNSNLEGDIVLYENIKGEFRMVKDAFKSAHLRLYAMPMAIADFNNDGLLDVYVGFPGEKDFSMASYDSSSNTNRSGKFIHGIYLNKGNLTFNDKTVSAFPDHSRYHTFPHGAVASDIDKDGDMDLVIMDDQRNLSPVLLNDGSGHFKMANNELNVSNFGFGMGVTVGDLNNDGQSDILISNATFHTESRIQTLGSKFGHNNFASKAGANQGLRVFMGVANQNKFYESTMDSGLGDVGDGAGGVTLIDYDNDGVEEIFVVNGLWSGTSKQSIDSLFAQAQILSLTDVNHLQDGEGEHRGLETQSVYMKSLIKEEVIEDGSKKSLNFAGKQRNRLFKNMGIGKYIDVAYLEGVDSQNDGYMSLVADINRDGKLDLLLRNCDSGPDDLSFPVVEVFENNYKSSNILRIDLVGKKSNKDAIGAKAVLKLKDKVISKEVIANNSATQSERTLHFGLGNENTASELIVYWPSGRVEKFKNIKAGHHTLIESNSNLVMTSNNK